MSACISSPSPTSELQTCVFTIPSGICPTCPIGTLNSTHITNWTFLLLPLTFYLFFPVPAIPPCMQASKLQNSVILNSFFFNIHSQSISNSESLPFPRLYFHSPTTGLQDFLVVACLNQAPYFPTSALLHVSYPIPCTAEHHGGLQGSFLQWGQNHLPWCPGSPQS